jgi:hypothetical protein
MEMDLIFPRKKMMQVPALAPDTAIPFSLDIVKARLFSLNSANKLFSQ